MQTIRNLIFLYLIIISCGYAQSNEYCNATVNAIRTEDIFTNQFAKTVVAVYRSNVDWDKVSEFNSELSKNLELVLSKMEQVNVGAKLGDPAYCNKDRTSEFYLYGEYKALFNPEWLNIGDFEYQTNAEREVQRSRVFLGLHILLGAAGFDDENYQKTIGLVSLSTLFPSSKLQQTPNDHDFDFPDLRSVVVETFAANKIITSSLMLANGGSTGVTGGGDLLSLWLKLNLLENGKAYHLIDTSCQNQIELEPLCREWPTKRDYLRFLFNFNLESISSIDKVEFDAEALENGIFKIKVPKISLRVMMSIDPFNKNQITQAMINHFARIAHEKQNK